jgi:hypothetical protein
LLSKDEDRVCSLLLSGIRLRGPLDRAFEDEASANLSLLPKESVDLAIGVLEVEGAGHIHQLDLIFSNKEFTDDKLCDGCMGLISTPFYNCTQCCFFLHNRCAQLPNKKRHQLHQNQLTLVSQVPYIGGLFSCDACGRLNCGFTYRCDTCTFDLDLRCCSISETLQHEGHQHFLFLSVNSSKRCHVCNCTYHKKPGIFVCISCDFSLGLECATLPLVARHRYGDHLLNASSHTLLKIVVKNTIV